MKNRMKPLKVHFIGIGGVSMSSLAKYLLYAGFSVSGSDLAPNRLTEELTRLGAEIYIGHDASHAEGAQAVVYTQAIGDDNPELKYARENKLFVMSRGQLLAMASENFGTTIGVSGCHGKTTTVCLLAHIFRCAKAEFTAHIGGEDLKFSNFVADGSRFFLSEVCEFKKNIDLFRADIAVCLNVDADHMDCYKNIDDLLQTYDRFLEKGKKKIVCGDDQRLAPFAGREGVFSFGFGENNDYRAENLVPKNGKYAFDVFEKKSFLLHAELNVYGRQNVTNCLAAVAAARAAGISADKIASGIRRFKGVKRRFEKIGKLDSATVICDYAHHPREIAAALETAKTLPFERLIVVFQPHTYSRTVYLKKEFVEVLSSVRDLILYPTYAARETYIEGGSSFDLHLKLPSSAYVTDISSLLCLLRRKAKCGDLILVLGAGDLYGELKKRI